MSTKIAKVITFNIKAGYHRAFLLPDTMKLFGRTKKMTKHKNGKNMPQL